MLAGASRLRGRGPARLRAHLATQIENGSAGGGSRGQQQHVERSTRSKFRSLDVATVMEEANQGRGNHQQTHCRDRRTEACRNQAATGEGVEFGDRKAHRE